MKWTRKRTSSLLVKLKSEHLTSLPDDIFEGKNNLLVTNIDFLILQLRGQAVHGQCEYK